MEGCEAGSECSIGHVDMATGPVARWAAVPPGETEQGEVGILPGSACGPRGSAAQPNRCRGAMDSAHKSVAGHYRGGVGRQDGTVQHIRSADQPAFPPWLPTTIQILSLLASL